MTNRRSECQRKVAYPRVGHELRRPDDASRPCGRRGSSPDPASAVVVKEQHACQRGSRLRVIGLVGGIASGKSLVARQLVDLGAGWLDADQAGHEVLELEEVKLAIRRRWGNEVFAADGRVSRPAIGRRVFGDGPEAVADRQFLERLTHPRIGEIMGRQAAALEQAEKEALVLDAPLLMEAGWDEFCDKTLFVECPCEVRLQRARERGWSEAEFAAREAAQESLDVKRKRADVVLDNSGSPESTREQVERFWRSLIG
jgi:dephospho-CoA kinase